MANFIRLKQIESGSALSTAASVGQDFNQSVVNIITSQVVAVLPSGVISSSAQVNVASASGFSELATDLEVSVISSSISSSQVLISSSISASIAATLSGSTLSVTALSQSVSASLNLFNSSFTTTASFHSYTASLGDTFATDVEVYQTASAIIDQGEF